MVLSFEYNRLSIICLSISILIRAFLSDARTTDFGPGFTVLDTNGENPHAGSRSFVFALWS